MSRSIITEGVLWYCEPKDKVALEDIVASVCQRHLERLGTEAKYICVHRNNPQTQGITECNGLPILTDQYQLMHHYYATRRLRETKAC